MRTSLSLILAVVIALVCTVGCGKSDCSGGKCKSPINVEAK